MKIRLRKNKKAGFFAIFLVLMTLILVGYTMHGFTLSRDRISSSFNAATDAVGFSQDVDKEQIYENEKVKDAAVQSFYDTSQQLVQASDNCKIVEHNGKEYFIFNQDCKPESDYLADTFLEKLTENEQARDYVFALEGGNLELQATRQEIEKESSFIGSFATYSLFYNVNTDYSFLLAEENMNLLDFTNLYSKAETCKNSANVAGCMNLKDWEFSFEKDSYNFFDFKTKKYYFYERGEQMTFAPIEISFALE
jgi:hypothetical protein